MPFTFTPLTSLRDDVFRATRPVDDRGWFMACYKKSALASAGIHAESRQDNQSFSARGGTPRGLYYHVPPAARGRLVRVVAGEIGDVVVEIRKEATFPRWDSLWLSAAQPMMLWIPEGFAYGFQTFAPNTVVLYTTTADYGRPKLRPKLH